MIPFATLAAEPQAVAGALSQVSEETGADETDPAATPADGTDSADTSANGTDPAATPADGTDPADTSANGTDPAATPADGTDPAATPADGTDPAATPADGTDPAATPADGTDPAATPADGTDPADTSADGTDPEGAPEPTQQDNQLLMNQRQAPYEVSYSGPNQTVEIPFSVFGEALNGMDMISAQVLDGQGDTLAQLKGKKDNFRSVVVLTMPDNLDLTAGTYDLDFILRQSWTGTEQVVSGLAVLKVAQDIQGVHLINTEIRYDGTDQGTFTLKFQNGTGGNRITSIDKVQFATRQPGGGATSTNLTQSNSGYTYDLDRGELYIPNAFFADRTLESVVYFVGMDYTLANGQKITYSALELTPDQPVSSEGFVNPGDAAWYFLYQPETEPDVPQEPCDLSYPGPNQTVEIPFDVFGEALNNRDMVSAQVLDDQGNPVARLEGRKDNFRSVVVLTMPWDMDLGAGTYDLRFLLGQSWTGEEAQLDGCATLTTDQDIQGVHLINTELRYDGTDQGTYVLRFQTGTGDNRVTDISRIRFMTRLEDGNAQGFALKAANGSFTCDLERGEITIPAASLARQELDPVVYFGMIDFTLANGETITANSLDILPDEAVRPGNFVNDGGNGWYLIPQTGVSLSGTVTTQGQAGDVTLTLTRQGETQGAYEVTLSGQTGTTEYTIPQVEAGSYTLTVSKENHAARDYALTVGEDPVEQDVELWLLGDVNGDGKVSTLDAALINSYVRSARELEDYPLACADVNGDGRVTTLDAAKINAFVRTGTAL